MPFQPGNKGGPGGPRPGAGRKPSERRRELDEALDQAIPPEFRTDILEMLANRARAGDAQAAALVLAYIYGKPGNEDVAAALEAEVEAYQETVLRALEVLEPAERDKVLAAIKASGTGG